MGYAAKLGGKNYGSGAGPIAECSYGSTTATKQVTEYYQVPLEYIDPDIIFATFIPDPNSTGTPQQPAGMACYFRKGLSSGSVYINDGNWACYNFGYNAYGASHVTSESDIQNGFVWWFYHGSRYPAWPNMVSTYYAIKLDH